MRVIEERRTDAGCTGRQGDADEATGALVNALKTIGLEDLDPADIAIEFRDLLIRLAGSWVTAISGSTLTSRRCDLRRFARWCNTQSEAPLCSDTSLSKLMERHLTDVGQAFAPGTVKRVGSNLIALAKGIGSDIAVDDARIGRIQATRAAQKLARTHGAQCQKDYITVPQMQQLRRAISDDASSLLAKRDLAMFDIACDLMASRAEIIRMRLRDVNLSEATVRFPVNRGNRVDCGSVFALSRRTVVSIGDWIVAPGVMNFDSESRGILPVFSGIMNDGKIHRGSDGSPKPMNGKTVTRAIQRYAIPLGISGTSSHSLRRSMARALYEAGVPEDEIVRKGRWSSLDQMRAYVGITVPIQGAADLIF